MLKPGETVARSPVPTPVPEETKASPAPSSRIAGSRASDTVSVLEGLEDSRPNSPEDTGDGRGAPEIKYTILHRDVSLDHSSITTLYSEHGCSVSFSRAVP